VQDAENLAWKLRLVLQGKAPEALLDSYDAERVYAADENILNSTRSTDFITPKSEASRAFRDATLELAKNCGFARRLVNSGRLSVPSTYRDSPLNTPDTDVFDGLMVPGAPAADAPVRTRSEIDWFLPQLDEGGFTGVYFGDGGELHPVRLEALRSLVGGAIPVRPLLIEPQGIEPRETAGVPVLEDAEGLLARRYDARPGTFYLLRPDQHVCARWRHFDPDLIRTAVARAAGHA
jgi:3-(3-hydroxy-phenyl)propionate hydroxylase